MANCESVRGASGCVRCTNPIPKRRYDLGYRLCLSCGDAQARKIVRTVVPLHKSNYVLVTRREDLKGINSKYVPV
jgi:hypothetical protein